MRHYIAVLLLFTLAVSQIAEAQRYVNRYPNAGHDEDRTSSYTLSERSQGFALRFGLEGGTMQSVSIAAEYEFSPYVSAGLGVSGVYHIKAGLGVPIYLEGRGYFPNRKYSAYVNVRLGGVKGVGGGRQVPTEMDVYGYKLTNVDKLGGFTGGFGFGFSWCRLDAGFYFGVIYGSFKKVAEYETGTFEQWKIRRKAYLIASLHLSYSLPIARKPYNKVITRH